MGIIHFELRGNALDGSLLAMPCFWLKCLSVLLRILCCIAYTYLSIGYIMTLENMHLALIAALRLLGCISCAVLMLLLQLRHGQRVLRLVNRYLRLFRRLRALLQVPPHGALFGGKRELLLLCSLVLCLAYESFCPVPGLLQNLTLFEAFFSLCEVYITVGAAMILHICFVGYLSLGVLYQQLNRFVRQQLRQQLRRLELQRNQLTRQQLRAAGCCLDECISIYDEVQRVSRSFQRLFDLHMCLMLLFGFLSMGCVCYYIMLSKFNCTSLWILVAKMLADIVLLTLAVQGAGSYSRVVKRLSVENFYITERSEWHKKLEMFLGRLNIFEFRVRPLGLFEVSNELILLFLSGLVTYLTYIIQYGLQTQ
ncbi:Gr93c [Drosophila busckii]|uniref:Gustatory receptor n=2 Tax=Drosophila busckii TaxID=30019 RepID=A0A0M4F4A1_DROBS|nr:Gr93c [Drosophila busckii]